MAETTVIRNGYDTWISSAAPTSHHPRDNRLRLKSTTSYGYIYFPLGVELRGNPILAAPFYLYGRDIGAAAKTLTVRRITSKWDAGTLDWNNRPSVGTTSVTLTQANTLDLTEWQLNLAALVQEFASGSRWYGIRVEIDDLVERRFNSLNATGNKPRLEVRWTEVPAAPVDQSPSGGRAVSTSRPVLTWSNDNSSDNTGLVSFEVQVDAAGNSVTTWTSGEVLSDIAEFDLSQSSVPALAANASTQWRVRVRNDAGWSVWSDWASYMRVDKGSVTIVTPGSTVADVTPPVAWTTTFTQSEWQVIVTDALDASVVLHDTGRKKGATQEYTIPEKDAKSGRRILRDTRDYRLVVRAWDAVDRESTPGDASYASAVVVFHYADDPTPNPVTNLSVVQVENTPYVDLTWQRPIGTPDGWSITANGKFVDTNIAGADLIVSGTGAAAQYRRRYKDARPGVPVDYRVKPKVNGAYGPSPVVTLKTVPTGLWVLGPDDIDVLVGVYGDDWGSFSMPDRATTIELPQSVSPVRVTQGLNGIRSDNIHGALQTWSGRKTDEWADRMLLIKKRDEPVTIYFGDAVYRAKLTDVLVEPSRDGGRTQNVSFGFFEVGTPEWLD